MAEKTPDASSTDHPELFGTTDWDTLFQTMKDSAEKAGKEIPVRPSRRDPEGSHPARFYINEQIYAAATEEKEKSNRPGEITDLEGADGKRRPKEETEEKCDAQC